jgi:FAD/FMN-containing dehydrogenase
MSKPGLPRLEARLRSNITGDVFFDAFNRGRLRHRCVVLPDHAGGRRGAAQHRRGAAGAGDLAATRVLSSPRAGGGTSQCGQTVNDGIVIDFSKHLNRIVSLDVENRSCTVEPASCSTTSTGSSKSMACGFRSTISTSSRATIGGMAGNNSCGGRSLRYGTMRDNTLSMDAALADGTLLHFGELPRDLASVNSGDGGVKLFRDMLDLGAREAAEITEKFPKVQRRVGGYNLDALVPRNAPNNLAHLLVGSEGTLAFTTQVELKLWPVIRNKVLGVCHFGSFYEAMDAAQHLVKLRPIAVELVDRTMLLAGPRDRDVPADHRRPPCAAIRTRS